MAEGWARALKGDVLTACSAGIEKHGLNPFAVRAMQEAGVDIRSQQSQTVADLGPVELDVVVTVCGHADENCPVMPGAPRVVHRPFDDPPRLAADLVDDEAKMEVYRRVRDEIRTFVEGLPGSLDE